MNKILSIVMIVLFFQNTFAEVVSEHKDWSGEKDVMTILGKEGCVAQTVIEETDASGMVTNTFRLQIIKLKASNGDYADPLMVSFPDTLLVEPYYEGVARTDTSSEYSLTLLQPTADPAKIVAPRYGQRVDIVRRIRRDATFKVGFKNKDTVVKEISYSLRGSSKTIAETSEACQ